MKDILTILTTAPIERRRCWRCSACRIDHTVTHTHTSWKADSSHWFYSSSTPSLYKHCCSAFSYIVTSFHSLFMMYNVTKTKHKKYIKNIKEGWQWRSITQLGHKKLWDGCGTVDFSCWYSVSVTCCYAFLLYVYNQKGFCRRAREWWKRDCIFDSMLLLYSLMYLSLPYLKVV